MKNHEQANLLIAELEPWRAGRVLVCGGREFTNSGFLFDALDRLYEQRSFGAVIHGAARGADTLAALWAQSRRLTQYRYPAN